MVLNRRQQHIIELLIEREMATVADLSEQFDVSAVTIRNDLALLAETGRILRTHGGAQIANGRVQQEQSFATRQRVNAEQKQAIGELAASLVQPVEPVLLDASSTAVAVATALKQRTDPGELTVVTTGIWTALELLGSPRIHVVLTGGHVRNVTGSITGSVTQQILDQFIFQKVFLGGWGITLDDGVTDTNLAEVELKRTILSRAKQVIAILDGGKFGRAGLASFASIDQLTHVVTDASAPPAQVAALRARGVDVLVAEPK